jgi:DNA (cytosine-5)-methyltransferase 1
MKEIKILELFGGIGACTKALKRLEIPHKVVDYVEIDKYAVASYNAINGTNFEPQDICEWNKDIEVDLIMHGSPCQDFSLAGLQAGGDKGSGTRSSLMYETIRIVEKLKPKYVIWENVKNLLSKKHIHNFNAYLETMEQFGYTNYYQVLNAKDYGIPQNRERVFTISIRKDIDKGFIFPDKKELKLKLKDMLENEVDEKYYLSEKMIKYISATGTANFKNPDCKINLDVARPLTTDNNKRAGTTNYLCDDLPNNFDLSIPIINNTKQGYLDARVGDGVNISSRMKYQRGNVQKESIQTITTSGGNERGVVVNETICLNSKGGRNGIEGLQPSVKDRVYDSNGIAACVATSTFFNPNYTHNLRIRKLTPKECWRLMGFDDEDYERASKFNSNTQLYKQAGNSIVVNVLEAIFTNLLLNTEQKR